MLKGNDFVEWEQTLWVEPIIDFNISLFREAPYNLHPRRFWMEKHVKRAQCKSFQIYQEKIIALAASLGSFATRHTWYLPLTYCTVWKTSTQILCFILFQQIKVTLQCRGLTIDVVCLHCSRRTILVLTLLLEYCFKSWIIKCLVEKYILGCSGS